MANKKSHSGANVPALRFPEFSGEWTQCTLGDITYNFSHRNKEHTQHPMFSVTNNRGFVPQSEQFEDREMVGEDIQAYKVIEKGDFAYNPARINVGSIAKYEGEEKCMISSLYVCFRVADNIDREWFMQLLKTPKMNFHYNLNGEGGVRVYLFYPNFARIRSSFPSIAEQKKIASMLSLIDERIITQSRIIEELTTLRSALIEKCSTQEGNVFELSDILKEIDNRSSFPNQYQVLSSTVKGIYSQKEYFNKEIASEDNKGYKVVKKGNVVLSPQNLWMGNINFNDRFDVGIVSPSYKVFSIKKGFNPFFIAALLKTKKALYEYLLSSEQGASVVRRNLNAEALMAIKFKIPETSKQDALANAINAIDSKMKNENAIGRQFETQKKSLFKNMFI